MENKFVRSCQKNSKEVQEALFALGYKWKTKEQVAQYLLYDLLYTRKDGTLGAGNRNPTEIPCLYNFTEEIKLVATLKPIDSGLENLAELRKQANILMDKIKEMEEKQ